MGFILRDFECHHCGLITEKLVPPNRKSGPKRRWTKTAIPCPNPKCDGYAVVIITFHGLVKVAGQSDLPPLLARYSGLAREVSPGKSLNRPWEEERDHSKVRWVEKKLPDGRMVRRPSIKIDEPKSRGLNSNLEKDLARTVVKRRS